MEKLQLIKLITLYELFFSKNYNKNIQSVNIHKILRESILKVKTITKAIIIINCKQFKFALDKARQKTE